MLQVNDLTQIVKLRTTGKTIKPYFSNVSKDGVAQEKFKRDWGVPMGKCVKANVKKGMTQVEIHDVFRACAKEIKAGVSPILPKEPETLKVDLPEASGQQTII